MPYKIIQDTSGYFVITKETGRKHSKVPFKTKKEASSQMRALYAAENQKEKTQKQSQSQGGLLPNFLLKQSFNPTGMEVITKLGMIPILKIDVVKEPLNKAIDYLARTVTSYPFDQLYHLFIRFYLVVDNQEITIRYEKNETVQLVVDNKPLKAGAEVMRVAPYKPNSSNINYFIKTAQNRMGTNYWIYDPFKKNCQDFIWQNLVANRCFNADLRLFILQEGVEASDIVKHAFKAVTDIASFGRKILNK